MEFLVQKRGLDDKAEATFADIMRSLELNSYNCSLNGMVEIFNNTMSSV